MSFRGRRPQFPPTDEQQAIIDAFMSGGDIAVTALAGSGKTTLLRFLALARIHTLMTYVAFNKSIASEAASLFPSNVTCRTMHSFAFRAVGHEYADRLNGQRIPSWKIADILNLPDRWAFGDFQLRGKQLARLVMDGVSRYCHSADPEPLASHIPAVPGLDSPPAHEALCEVLYPYLLAAWADLSRTRGQLRFEHDYYLKIWSLQDPILPGSVILADEVQDLDPVTARIIAQQKVPRAYVGDPNQSIYTWRGAVDVLSKIDAEHRLPLTKSFRFGPVIAEEANRLLAMLKSDLRVVGHEPVESRLAVVERPDVMLCRTNAAAVGRLMEAQVNGLRAALVGGTAQVEALARAAMKLCAGERTDHPELMAFENWTQVQDYVSGDAEGKELKVLVDMVDTHGAVALLEAVQQAVPEPEAEVVISTGHKSKGREWKRVRLDADFPVPIAIDPVTGNRTLRKEEVRLAYVVVTRTIEDLDSRSLEYLDPVAAQLGEVRTFVVPDENEEPERARVVTRSLPTEQLICDPESPERLMFRRTRYDPALVDAQRALPGRRFFKSYCAEDNVNVVEPTAEAIEVAEQFGLSISDDARARVAGRHPETAPAAGSPDKLEPARE